MKQLLMLVVAAVAVSAALVGCTDPPAASSPAAPATTPKEKEVAGGDAEAEAEIRDAMAKLSPADREVAEAQKYCAIMSDTRLGAMGPPRKVMVKDQPVFVCCKGCEKKALANPDKTLAKVDELKKAAAK